MIGKKARCTCGTVVVLIVEEESDLELLELEPLEEVHLEPLDDEPLIADSVGQSRASITLSSGQQASPGTVEPLDAEPLDAVPIKVEALDAFAVPDEKILDEPIVLDATAIESSPIPEVSVKQVPALPKPAMKSRATPTKRRKPSDKASSQSDRPRSRSSRPRPNTEKPSGSSSVVTESRPRRSKRKSGKKRANEVVANRPEIANRPVIADSFGDVDDILNGGVDGSPVRAKPKPNPPAVSTSSLNSKANSTRSGSEPEKTTGPSFGGIVSIFGGVAGVCFGAIALATKQLSFSDSPLSWLGEPMHGMYQAAYGHGQVEGMFRALFLSLGWAMILVALVSIVAGLSLAARGLIKIFANSNQFGWSRAFAAIVGVTGLFLVVSILLTQYSHNDHLVSQLDNSGAVGLVEEPQQFQRLREQYAEDKESFSIAMLFMASMPLALAVSSAVGLFCDQE